LVFLLSLVGIFAQIIGRILMPNVPQGVTTILVVVMFIGGIQLLCISVLGEYIGKIFEEVKQRPQFIVKSIFRTRPARGVTPDLGNADLRGGDPADR